MLIWSSSAWLLALAVVPLIWLLHRLRHTETSVAVSSLLFWKPVAAETKWHTSGAKSDPLWLLRALIAAIIVISIAGPRWLETDMHIIDIWFDDSFSMQTLENGISRYQLANTALDANLRRFGKVKATIHSLSDPLYPPLLLESSTNANWPEQLQHWFKIGNAPLQQPLPGNGEQWLVTDATHSTLNGWLTPSRISQILQVGSETENSAISLLSMRPNLKNPSIWDIVIRLNHFGFKPDQRTLELASGSNILEHRDFVLAPNQSYLTEFSVASDQLLGQRLTARFSATDALPQDDQLNLVTSMPIATRLDGNCPPPLIAAIQAHPFLNIAISASTRPELNIVCGNTSSNPADAIIRFHQATPSRRLDATPVWLPSADNLNDIPLPQQHLAYFQTLPSPQGIPLLVAEQTPLITLSETAPRTLDCFIDFGAEDFSRQPEYPLMFAGLVDIALNKVVLDTVRQISIPADESRIAPQPLQISPETTAAEKGSQSVDIVPYLLSGVILLLLIDGLLSKNKR